MDVQHYHFKIRNRAHARGRVVQSDGRQELHDITPSFLRALVVDAVRQIGPPNLFQTHTPAEWYFPLHEAVEDMVVKLGARDHECLF